MGAQSPSAAAAKVLAVVVARDPGGWLEEALASLRRQDYENMSVVVVDAADGSDGGRSAAADAADAPAAAAGPLAGAATAADAPAAATADHEFAARVRAVVSDAAIISAPGASGFAAAANTVLATGLTSAFLLVCHDDAALAPDAVTTLVAQAGRSGADVAGPKLVHWDRPEVIQHVGFEVDRFGAGSDMAGAEELDQEQHDVTRDVFAVSTAAVLIRSDLFARIGGFDTELASRGGGCRLVLAGSHGGGPCRDRGRGQGAPQRAVRIQRATRQARPPQRPA